MCMVKESMRNQFVFITDFIYALCIRCEINLLCDRLGRNIGIFCWSFGGKLTKTIISVMRPLRLCTLARYYLQLIGPILLTVSKNFGCRKFFARKQPEIRERPFFFRKQIVLYHRLTAASFCSLTRKDLFLRTESIFLFVHTVPAWASASDKIDPKAFFLT